MKLKSSLFGGVAAGVLAALAMADMAQGAKDDRLAEGLRALTWSDQPQSVLGRCPEPGGADCTHS